MIRHLVTRVYLHIQFARLVEDGTETDTLKIIGMQRVNIRPDRQVQCRQIKFVLTLREHLMRHIEHNLSVACPPEREQHLKPSFFKLLHPLLFDLLTRAEAKMDELQERSRHKRGDKRHQN